MKRLRFLAVAVLGMAAVALVAACDGSGNDNTGGGGHEPTCYDFCDEDTPKDDAGMSQQAALIACYEECWQASQTDPCVCNVPEKDVQKCMDIHGC